MRGFTLLIHKCQNFWRFDSQSKHGEKMATSGNVQASGRGIYFALSNFTTFYQFLVVRYFVDFF